MLERQHQRNIPKPHLESSARSANLWPKQHSKRQWRDCAKTWPLLWQTQSSCLTPTVPHLFCYSLSRQKSALHQSRVSGMRFSSGQPHPRSPPSRAGPLSVLMSRRLSPVKNTKGWTDRRMSVKTDEWTLHVAQPSLFAPVGSPGATDHPFLYERQHIVQPRPTVHSFARGRVGLSSQPSESSRRVFPPKPRSLAVGQLYRRRDLGFGKAMSPPVCVNMPSPAQQPLCRSDMRLRQRACSDVSCARNRSTHERYSQLGITHVVMSSTCTAPVSAGQGLLPPTVRGEGQGRTSTFAEHPFKLLHDLVHI